jgi:hypothetical protein
MESQQISRVPSAVKALIGASFIVAAGVTWWTPAEVSSAVVAGAMAAVVLSIGFPLLFPNQYAPAWVLGASVVAYLLYVAFLFTAVLASSFLGSLPPIIRGSTFLVAGSFATLAYFRRHGLRGTVSALPFAKLVIPLTFIVAIPAIVVDLQNTRHWSLQVALKDGNYQRAIETATARLMDLPGDPLVLYYRAIARFSVGQQAEAADDLAKARSSIVGKSNESTHPRGSAQDLFRLHLLSAAVLWEGGSADAIANHLRAATEIPLSNTLDAWMRLHRLLAKDAQRTNLAAFAGYWILRHRPEDTQATLQQMDRVSDTDQKLLAALRKIVDK